MMKAFGGCLLLTASLLFLSKGAAAGASQSHSGDKERKGKSGNGEYVDPIAYRIADANEELKDYMVTQVVDSDDVAMEQFDFAQTVHTECLRNNTSSNSPVQEACAAAFDEALKGVNQDLKGDIVGVQGFVDEGLGFNIRKIKKKLRWLKKRGIKQKKQARLERIIKDFETSKASLKQTGESTVSCEIDGLEEVELNMDDIREAFEAMLNMALIRNEEDEYFNNFTWDDEATVTRVRNLGRHGSRLASMIRGQGTRSCKSCMNHPLRNDIVNKKKKKKKNKKKQKNKKKKKKKKKKKRRNNIVKKRTRRLPERRGEDKYSRDLSEYSSSRSEKSKMKSTFTSKDSAKSENKMLAFWEKMMKKSAFQPDECTEGFKINHVDGSLAMLVAMKVGSQVDNEDFSVSCCFKNE
eukprot:scaffold149980_cov52-Attheya_sp.AAC.1